MRLVIQFPVIIGLCGLLWLSAELNASWLDRQLFPNAQLKHDLSLAQSIADRLADIRLELRSARTGTSTVTSVSVRR